MCYKPSGVPVSTNFVVVAVVHGVQWLCVCVVIQAYGDQYISKDTSLMEFLNEGVWFIGVFNDGDSPQTIGYTLNHHCECTSYTLLARWTQLKPRTNMRDTERLTD